MNKTKATNNLLTVTIISLIILLVVPNSSAYFNSTGLLFQMNFTSQANDSLGLNNGTTSGTVTYPSNADCPIANRYPCYNSTGSGQEIIVANTSIWRSGVTNLTSWMINYWVREKDVTASRNDRHFWANSSINGDYTLQILSGSSGGKVYAQIKPQTTNTNIFNNATPVANTAYMRTIYSDGTNLYIYQNGTLINSTSYAGGLRGSNQSVRWFGANNIAAANSLNGTADEVTVWNTTGYTKTQIDSKVNQMYTDYVAGYGPEEDPAGPGFSDPGDVYISWLSGNDSQAGNSTHPIKTIKYLTTSGWFDSGDTAYFDGTPGNVWRTPSDYRWNDTSIPDGTSGDYTKITCYNCNATNKPIFTASASLSTTNWTASGIANVWKLANNPGMNISNFVFGNITTNNNLTTGYRINNTYNTPTNLNAQGEWWQNRSTSSTGDYQVYMYSVGNPGTYYGNNIEMVYAAMNREGNASGKVFYQWSTNYVIFEKLKIIAADYAFDLEGSWFNITNNTIGYIGGGFCGGGCGGLETRWGNAIQLWKGTQNTTVNYNTIYEVYDAALSPQATATSTYTAQNQIWSYNKVWNSAYCFEHYYSPTTAKSINIQFTHNTCSGIGEGWYAEQRLIDSFQTVKPRFLRVGLAYNVRGFNFSDNLLYNSTQYAYGYEIAVAGWNTTANYTFKNNYVYRDTSSGLSSYMFNVNATNRWSTLSSWQAATVHDDGSYSSSVFPFTANDNTFIPTYGNQICTMSGTGSYVGAEPCAAPTTKTLLTNAPDLMVSPPSGDIYDEIGNCGLAYDGDTATGVESNQCTNITLNWTNPGNLVSGESSIRVTEYIKLYPSLVWSLQTNNYAIPAACEDANITIRAEYVSDYSSNPNFGQVMRYYCYDGASWQFLGSTQSQDPIFHWTYEIVANFSRTDYIQYVSPTPDNATTFINGQSKVYNLETRLVGGDTVTSQYFYNQTGSLIAQYNTTDPNSYSLNYTLPRVGVYRTNSTIENDTHIAISETREYYSFVDVETTNPTASQVVANYVNFTWTTTGTVDSSIYYIVTLYNSTGGFNKTINASTTLNYQYIDLLTIGEGVWTLRVTANDSISGLYEYDEVTFISSLETLLIIKAYRYTNNDSITTFSASVTQSNTTDYTTTNGTIYAIIERNMNTNITVSATSFISNTTTNLNTAQETYAYNVTLRGLNNLNITFRDQANLAIVNQTVYLDLISDYYSYNYSTSNGQLSLASIESATYTLRYISSGYTERFYTLTIEDTTDQTNLSLTLYLVNSSIASNLTVYIIDELTIPVEGAIVKALKYYLANNTYLLQEIGVTDNAGKIVMTLTRGDEYYKFMVEYQGELVKITDPAYITTDSMTIPIQLGASFMDLYNDYNGIEKSLTFNSATNNFRLDYSYPDGVAENTLLVVYRVDNLTYTLYDTVTSTSASGTFLSEVLAGNGTVYKAFAYYYDSDLGVYRYLSSYTYEYADTPSPLATTGVLMQIFLTLGISSLVFLNAPAAMILTPLSLILGRIVGLHDLDYTALFGLLFVGFIFALMLMRMKK